MKKTEIGRILLIALASLGVAIMGYLIYLHYSDGGGSAFCELGEGLSCDAVNKSEYSEIFGIPISGLGLLYFLGVLLSVLFSYSQKTLKRITGVTILFLGPSLYLTGIEFIVLKNVCIFCEASKVLMIAIVLVSVYFAGFRNIGKNLIITSIIGAAVLAGSYHFIQGTAGPGDKYVAFGQCLYEKGFRMYGSAGCVFCAKQRALFGEGIERVREIECDPRFEGAQYELCIEKNIAHTPTWILEDSDGNDIFRFESGVISLAELSEKSNCPLTEVTEEI